MNDKSRKLRGGRR